MKPYDEKAGKDPAFKAMIETGVAALERRGGAGRLHGRRVGSAARRAAARHRAPRPSSRRSRSGLVVGLYNQKEIWPIFGYEGESYSKGGYISRGFDDIDWL